MALAHPTPRLARTEDAVIVLFCLTDEAYRLLNPRGQRYESLKKLSDSEVLALALLQQLRGVESERSFLRDCERFFSHLFPGIVGFHPSSFHRRVRKLRRFLEPLRRALLEELAGDPETLIVDSTLLPVLHPRQVKQSAAGFEGAAWSRWGSFCVYGVKLHLVCSTNRVPISYEMTAANEADVLLVEELLAGAALEEGEVARRLFGDLAYESGALRRRLAESGILLSSGGASRRPATRQQIEVCFAHLKGAFGLGQTLAKTLVGLTIRIAAKVTAYTYGLYVNRLLGRPQGRIKELWA
jgi:Transposase DDE domain